MNNIMKFVFLGLAVLVLSSCDAWDYGEHPQITAIKKISEYADSNDTKKAPDLALYKKAGIKIDSEDINATNDYIRTLTSEDVDTHDEIQDVVDNIDAYTNVAPVAKINVESTSVKEGEILYLDAIGSSDSDGAIASYEWKIGSKVVHKGISYDASLNKGRYIIELVVKDDYNATGSDMVSVIVRDVDDNNTEPEPEPEPNNKRPEAKIEVSDNNGTIILKSVSTDDKKIVKTDWKEGSRTLATNKKTYDASKLPKGDHTITLTVEDKEGLTDSATKKITIK